MGESRCWTLRNRFLGSAFELDCNNDIFIVGKARPSGRAVVSHYLGGRYNSSRVIDELFEQAYARARKDPDAFAMSLLI